MKQSESKSVEKWWRRSILKTVDGRKDGRTPDATPWHKLIRSFGPDELKTKQMCCIRVTGPWKIDSVRQVFFLGGGGGGEGRGFCFQFKWDLHTVFTWLQYYMIHYYFGVCILKHFPSLFHIWNHFFWSSIFLKSQIGLNFWVGRVTPIQQILGGLKHIHSTKKESGHFFNSNYIIY